MDLDSFLVVARVVGRLQGLEQELGGRLERGGASPLQARLLHTVYLEGPQTIGALADCLGLRQPNASREVTRLCALGLLEKVPHPEDKRRTAVRLSEAGCQLVRGHFRQMAEQLEGLGMFASPQDADRFLAAFRTIEEYLPGTAAGGAESGIREP